VIYYISNSHTPIISKEEFVRVGEKLAERAALYGNFEGDRDKYKKRYEFTGKIVCCNCGSAFRRRVWNSKAQNPQIVWMCSTYIEKGKSACSMKAVDDITVKTVFVQMFNRFFNNREQFIRTLERNIHKALVENEIKPLSAKESEIAELRESMKTLVRLNIQKNLDDNSFSIQYEALEKKLNVLQGGCQKEIMLEKEIPSDKTKQVMNAINERNGLLTEFDTKLFEALVERIEVITPEHLRFIFKDGTISEERFIKKKGINNIHFID